MVTKLLWKYDLVADATFDAFHKGFTDGYEQNKLEEMNKCCKDLRINKRHYYLFSYKIGERWKQGKITDYKMSIAIIIIHIVGFSL